MAGAKKHGEQLFAVLIKNFFSLTVGEFFDSHSECLTQLSRKDPIIYSTFVEPVILKCKGEKLFRFWCNPYIYEHVMTYIALGDTTPDRSLRGLAWMEDLLSKVKEGTDYRSHCVIKEKVQYLLKSCGNLQQFTDRSSGLVGEIQVAENYITRESGSKTLVHFLPESNRTGKSCDLEIKQEDGIGDLVEVKTKSPRHGVQDPNYSILDSFFTNHVGSICSFLNYLCKKHGSTVWQEFPALCMYQGADYGQVLPIIRQITTPDSQANIAGRVDSPVDEVMIECMLRNLRGPPHPLEPATVPLPLPQSTGQYVKEPAFGPINNGKWFRDPVTRAISQLTEYRASISGCSNGSSTVCFVIRLSHRLTRNFFAPGHRRVMHEIEAFMHHSFASLATEMGTTNVELHAILD